VAKDLTAITSRKRYIVQLKKNGETRQVVIIAKSLDGMYREVYRLFGDFLTDEQGKDIGTISFVETDLQSMHYTLNKIAISYED
jgi:hypothetical protein